MVERLTEHHADGKGAYMACSGICDNDGCNVDCKEISNIVDRLAAYEDTGLEPEEIKEVQEAMVPIPFGRFHDIMEAERAGRLVLPSDPNTPLTMEELREMEIREWCWVEIVIPSAFRKVESCYYCKFSDYTEDRAFCCGWPGTIFSFDYVDYGKTWLAYRRKPGPGRHS